MANDLAAVFAGFDRMEGHVLDSTGFIAGKTGTVAPGGSDPGFRILGIKEAQNMGVPEPEVVPVVGDDHYIAGFVFPSQAARRFTAVAAVVGLDVIQYMGSGNAYAVGGGNIEVGFLDVVPFSPVNVALISTSQAKSGQGADVGLGQYGGYIVSQCQGIPLGRQTMQEKAAGAMRFGFIESLAGQFPWGETYQTTPHGVTQSAIQPWQSLFRIAMQRLTGNGVLTVFPLLYQPASTSLADVLVYFGGVLQTTGYTIQQAAQTITFTPAPTNNQKIAVVYNHL